MANIPSRVYTLHRCAFRRLQLCVELLVCPSYFESLYVVFGILFLGG